MNINTKALIETLKEAGRWILLFVVSWIITETLAQIDLVPESQSVQVWVFTYVIPVRLLVHFGLTALARLVDKYLHEREVTKPVPQQNEGWLGTKGLTGF